MKEMLWLLFVSLLGELWLSLEAAHRETLGPDGLKPSFCSEAISGKTCFTTFHATISYPVRRSFKEANNWCKLHVPGSSLIVINSIESKRIAESFIGRQLLANETIIMDAQKLSASESLKWSWVNGQSTLPIDVRTQQSHDGACVESKRWHSLAYCTGYAKEQCSYICEYPDSKTAFSHRQSDKSYYAIEGNASWYDARKNCLRLGRDLASITNLPTVDISPQLKYNQRYWIGLHRNKWIWNSTGAAITYTDWEGGYPDESSDKQCICINPRCRSENNRTMCLYDRKWRTCNCNHDYAIVCQKEEKVTTKIVATEGMLTSNSPIRRTSVSRSTPKATTTSTKTPIATTTTIRTTSSIKTPIPTTTTITTSANTPIATTTTIRTTSSTKTPIPTTTTITTSTKTPIATTPTTTTITATTAATKPVISSVTTYTSNIDVGEIDRKTALSSSLTQQQSDHFSENQTTAFTSSSTGLFNSFSTKEILLVILLLVAVVFIVAAVFVIIRKRKYDRRNEESPTRNTKQSETDSSAYATVVPVNRPSEGTVPPGNTIYAEVEMFQRPTPSNNTNNASVKPTSNFNVIYAEPNKPTKSSTPTGEAVEAADPIYLEAIEVKPGAGSGGFATQDPSAVYAEPIKVKKLS